MKKAEVNTGKRAGVPTEVTDKMKTLEREVRELRQADEIRRKAIRKNRRARDYAKDARECHSPNGQNLPRLIPGTGR